MKIKTIISTVLLLSAYLHMFGQDRVNRQKLSFAEVSNDLTKATGWAYNSTLGEWIDYDNVISNDKNYKDKYKSLQGEWMRSKTNQNFIKIQTKTVILNNVKYYVLMVDKWSGRYQYPTIREDWYTFKETFGYIFTEDEFKKLENLDKKLELKTKSLVSLGGKYEKYDETKFLDLIQTELTKEKNKYLPDYEYVFPVIKSNTNAIRFFLPDISKYSNNDFDKEYFETDNDNFFKILIKK